MSDSENESGPFIFFGNLNEEMARLAEQGRMTHQAFYHEMIGFMSRLSDDDMLTLISIIRLSVNHSDQIGGTAEGILASRGYCMACNIKHDAAVEEILSNESNRDDPKESETEPSEEAMMAKYNVRRDDVIGSSNVLCNGCGMVYQSLDDRMLRPPSQCMGCQHKAKWG